jgi:hypothetical protein
MVLIPSLEISRSSIHRDGTGRLTILDPESSIVLVVEPAGDGDIRSLTVVPKEGYKLTASALGRIPISQIRRLVRQSTHPNDLVWKHSVTQRKLGERSWPATHWDEVMSVATWARTTKRPGGAARAIMDLWGVSLPTVRRWMRQCHSRSHGALPSSDDD